jgi:hypothetical protein
MPRPLVSRALLSLLAIVATLVAACGSTAGSPTPPNANPTAAASTSSAASPSASATARRSPEPRPGTATPPAGWPTPAVLTPATPLPKPAGAALPADLIGREYVGAPIVTDGIQAEVLTLRAEDDPHCMAMYHGTSTCFTILWTPNYPNHVDDPAVRGPARIVEGNLMLGFALVPYDPACEGTTSTYSISPDGWLLNAIDAPDCSYRRFVRH